MRTRLWIAVTVLAVAFGGSLAPAPPAGAAAIHTATVTPSTGLSDGQTVSVSGTGFDETPIVNDWAVIQCSAGILSGTLDVSAAVINCDLATSVITPADPAGNINTAFAVRKDLTIGIGSGTAFTCGQAPNDCAILIAQLTSDGQFTAAATPISFGAPTRTLGECIREFLGDHQHRVRYRFHRLLVCIFTVLIHHRPD